MYIISPWRESAKDVSSAKGRRSPTNELTHAIAYAEFAVREGDQLLVSGSSINQFDIGIFLLASSSRLSTFFSLLKKTEILGFYRTPPLTISDISALVFVAQGLLMFSGTTGNVVESFFSLDVDDVVMSLVKNKSFFLSSSGAVITLFPDSRDLPVLDQFRPQICHFNHFFLEFPISANLYFPLFLSFLSF